MTAARYLELQRNYKLATDTEMDELANFLTWGTYGPAGDQPLTHKRICQLETDHIANILVDQVHISNLHRKVFLHVYTKRITALDISVTSKPDASTIER